MKNPNLAPELKQYYQPERSVGLWHLSMKKKKFHLPKGVIDGNDPRLRRSRIMSLRGGERPNGEIRSWQFN